MKIQFYRAVTIRGLRFFLIKENRDNLMYEAIQRQSRTDVSTIHLACFTTQLQGTDMTLLTQDYDNN